MKRKAAGVGALTVALLVQLTIVNGLALPAGGTPDLVLLCVVALGLTSGPAPGLIAGFGAGVALDLAPPATQLAGQYALVLCLAGYFAGRLRFTLRRSAALAIAAAAVIAALGEAMAAALTLMLDAPEVTWATVAHVLPPTVLYDLVLGPFVLLCWVRSAVALGVSFDPREDSPALEAGGSAAPVRRVAAPGLPGRLMPRQAGQRLAIGGDSRAAASGRWLVGDVAEDAPAVGAIGWLAGPVRSRRIRREQARLTAMLTGAAPRRGAFWVGRRPPGLVPVQPPAPPRASGPARLRPGSGVPGTAAAPRRPGPEPVRRSVHLGLAAEQRRRARGTGRRPLARRDQHGVDRHGVNGPGLPSIGFGTGTRPAAGPARGRSVPQITFGNGSLPGGASGGPAGRRVPRIAFGTASPPGGAAGGPAGRRVPRIAFGTRGLPGGAGAGPAGRHVRQVAFWTGRLPGGVAGVPAGRRVPRIAFGTASLPGSAAGVTAGRRGPRIVFGAAGLAAGGRGSAALRVPRIAFSARGAAPVERARAGRNGASWPGDGWMGRRPAGARPRGAARIRLTAARPGMSARLHGAAPRFASGAWLAGAAGARAGFGLPAGPGGTSAAPAQHGHSALRRPARKVKRPRFGRRAAGLQLTRPRQPKAARMSAGRRSFRGIPWLRRAGDRSTVWRIGSRRTGGHR